MHRYLLSAFVLLVSTVFVSAAQSGSGSGQTAQAEPPAATPAATAAPAAKNTDAKSQAVDKNSAANKKKPKKVWTDDDISKVQGGISVVGDANSSNGSSEARQEESAGSENATQESQISNYREQLRQLQAQLDVTDKKIDDLRNFKAEDTSASGGINPNHGYTMTPVADQIKQLEDKRKQIQDKIDAVTDEARKKGIEPGQLR
jgi:chromosome segregation ATPase